ncbi:MAG: hypothetical protein ABH986_00225 [archaeon]
MKNKVFVGLFLVLLVFLSGCAQEKVLFDDAEAVKVPDKCIQQKDDVCGLFACMVDNCWCESSVEDPVLFEGNTTIQNEQQAISVVEKYLLVFSEPHTMTSAVKLNSVFYNLFVDFSGEEKVFTVAADGTIIRTQCGV